tara:strand:- start:652 stop:993 length:342 start_codon:yes stop_codon:yes gene_type:complete
MVLANQDLSVLQILLDGGVPLLLLIALIVVSKLYYAERNIRTAEMGNYRDEVSALKTDYSNKVESLLRERLESETENTKVILRATEAMSSVNGTLEHTNTTLKRFIEATDATS